ncbi:NU4M oxidoreductase, partial [Acromyrmex charruanus]
SRNPERLSAGYYIIICILLISFPLLFRLMIVIMGGYNFTFRRFLMIYIVFFIKIPIYIYFILILSRLMTLFKVGIVGRYIIIISHGLCSSGIFYMVNLYYERSGRRLLFLSKGLVRNLEERGDNNIDKDFKLRCLYIGICKINLFFRSVYSLYLYSYVYHGKNIYYENKIYNSNLKEYIILIIHFFPLLIYLLNLIIFI